MRRSSKIALALGAVLLMIAGALLRGGPRVAPTPPEELIRETLRAAETAARARNMNGVMESVSDRYKDSAGLNKPRLRLLLNRALVQARGVHYDVRVFSPTISFTPGNPDRAIVLTSISVYDTGSEARETLWGGENISLVMERETERRWFFWSSERWRITSVVNLPPLPGIGDMGT